MNWMSIVLMIECFVFGGLIGWITFDIVFYKPQNKLLKEVMNAHLETLELCRDMLQMARSMPVKSPIQFKK